MTTRAVRTIEVTIERPFAEIYAFLAEPANFPSWASGLCSAIARVGDAWIATTPHGPAEVRFTPRNAYGVLDHTVVPAAGHAVDVPMRVIANGDGATLVFTLFRQPEMSEVQFAADAEWVGRDLLRLRALLETG